MKEFPIESRKEFPFHLRYSHGFVQKKNELIEISFSGLVTRN